ncbi:hypothetical protein GF367_03805 [Candidatus Woesearchaeota archaeon]|nr:hypothetical protein [Candidatus Woesearchaeota archaeon]
MDTLLELLKKKGKLSLSEASKELGIEESTIKLWVDFLVEEKVIGIEYKFTKPYIYLNKPKDDGKGKIINEEQINIKTFKDQFEHRAAASSIPKQQVGFLWKDHVLNQLELEKPFFFREARKRGLDDIDQLWEAYRQQVTSG